MSLPLDHEDSEEFMRMNNSSEGIYLSNPGGIYLSAIDAPGSRRHYTMRTLNRR